MEAEDNNFNNNSFEINNESKESQLNEEEEESLFSQKNSPNLDNFQQENPNEDTNANKTKIENEAIEDEKLENTENLFEQEALMEMEKIEELQNNFDYKNNSEKESENPNVAFKLGENYKDCLIIINKKVFENYNEDRFNVDLIKKKIHRSKGI